jgi:hypothetical protein
MKHSMVGKLIRAAALSALALTTISGVAVLAASPAMSQPNDLGGRSVPGSGSDQPDPTSTPIPTPAPTLPIP